MDIQKSVGLKIATRSGERLSTGSLAFDNMLGGGLATCGVTDIYGAAGTGKTQFAFLCSLIISQRMTSHDNLERVVFVDCSGSFRPERIAEMSESRGLSNETNSILGSISAIKVSSVSEQKEAIRRILAENEFSQSKLIIVDDVTRNFVSEYGTKETELMSRQREIAKHARNLAYMALSKGAAVLLTNSVRSTMDGGEKETTGDLISQFALFRIHLTKYEGKRKARLLQPSVANSECAFEINERGIVP